MAQLLEAIKLKRLRCPKCHTNDLRKITYNYYSFREGVYGKDNFAAFECNVCDLSFTIWVGSFGKTI